MHQNNYKSCKARISREFCMLSLVFIFLFGGYADTEEIQDKAFFASEEADTSVHEVAYWIVNSRDNKEKPFVIVDKKQAKIYVFRKEGLIIATSPALIGQAIGDFSFPGVGEK
jgi:hypothetical protein